DDAAREFFNKQLGDISETCAPFNLMNVQGGGDSIDEQEQKLSPDLTTRIREQALRLKLSPAALFHSAYAMVIAACSGQKDVVFGTVMSGRLQGIEGAASMTGMFINTLPLRISLTDKSAEALVRQTHEALQQLLPHEQVSLAFAQSCSAINGDAPLFTALLNYRHSRKPQEGSARDILSSLEFIDPNERTNYPFSVAVDDYGQDFLINVQVESQIDAGRILDYMITALTRLTDLLANNTQDLISQYSVLPEKEQQSLFALSATAQNYPDDKCIYDLFEAQVAKTPDNTALIFQDQQLSYRQLEQRANQLARHLLASGAKPEALVALYMERSIEMLVAIWGVLKTGAAYVPLDPQLPASRVDAILDDSQPLAIISQQHLTDKLNNLTEIPVLAIDEAALAADLAALSPNSIERPRVQSPLSCAYVIYTSGSTGMPKGVVCTHQGLVNQTDAKQKQYPLTTQDKVLQKTPYSFDVSLQELIWPLISGACLVIAKPEGHKDPKYLEAVIKQHGITSLHFVPSMLNLMLAGSHWSECSSVRQVFCSGEALSKELQDSFFTTGTRAKLYNLYGPTEAAIDVSHWTCDPTSSIHTVPIGHAMQNTQLLVLNENMQLTPLGVTGELHIGGAGLARGYLNREELTAKQFVDNPFPELATTRLYKTGDLVRYLPDGSLEYLGRSDHQVKIRGLRIELGEIEHQLKQLPEIASALVVAHTDQQGEQHLVAYFIGEDASRDNSQLIPSLKQQLGQVLPDYMVPAIFISQESWPLTVSGKIDRKALPEPELSQQRASYVAPSTETEKILCEIWQEVLTIPRVGVTDNFFELGGHSLRAMQVMSQLQQAGFSVEVRQLFQHPQLSDLAREITSDSQTKAPSFKAPDNMIPVNASVITPDMLPLMGLNQEDIEKVIAKVPGGAANIQDIYPLAPLQQGILFHHMMDPQNDPYVMPAYLTISGTDNFNQFIFGLNQVIARHDTLRTAVLWRDMPQPVQVVYRTVELPINRVSLPGDENEDLLSRFKAYDQEQTLAVDIEQGPLLSLTVAHDSDNDKYMLRLLTHHVITDHVTMDIIQQELSLIFTGQQELLPEPVQYREFVAFAKHQEQEQDDAAREFFNKQLGDISETCAPFNLMNVQGGGDSIDEQEQKLTPDLTARIREQALRLKLSPAALFHSAYAMVIAACSGQKD
uniref:non-ribosomal peptide synthetase n=1 Tax=Thalassomonas sp. RHCl1 TaxID=2995320 RepID=UPI00248BBD6C